MEPSSAVNNGVSLSRFALNVKKFSHKMDSIKIMTPSQLAISILLNRFFWHLLFYVIE